MFASTSDGRTDCTMMSHKDIGISEDHAARRTPSTVVVGFVA